ncbi:transposase [Actinomyces israelii]|uniref:transposase n=1 Tax=Actinomyces israelii TaxID=1659 RepID=UPI00146FAA24|nr:transposase [Actinomyces israelii]
MSAQGLSSELGEQVVLEVVEKDRTIAEVARSYGLVPQTVGNWVKKWRKDHPESVDSEVGAEQSAESRRLRAWLREARSWEASSEKSGFLTFAQRVPVGARYALRPPR